MYSMAVYDDVDYSAFGTGTGAAIPLEDFDFDFR